MITAWEGVGDGTPGAAAGASIVHASVDMKISFPPPPPPQHPVCQFSKGLCWGLLDSSGPGRIPKWFEITCKMLCI